MSMVEFLFKSVLNSFCLSFRFKLLRHLSNNRYTQWGAKPANSHRLKSRTGAKPRPFFHRVLLNYQRSGSSDEGPI